MDSNVATSQPLRLEMLDISKSFPGVQALSEVNLRVRPGEVHALLGENGAGKSTLIKILSGAYSRDSGRILLDGEEITIHSPHHALQLGIVTIYQDFNLALELTVAENVFMGRIPMRGPWVNWKILFSDTQKLLDQLDAGFSANTVTSDLSPAQRQLVEIAKALSMTARVIVLDEPTSALTSKEVDTLFATIGRLRQTGVAIILITHRLPEVFRICDRLTVLRDGQWITSSDVAATNEDMLVAQMVGRQVSQLYPERAPTASGEFSLDVQHLSGKGFKDISFNIRAGEIVGLFGLVGSGRTELARGIFGAERITDGRINICGTSINPRIPGDAIRSGLVLVPEDRKTQGLVLGLSVRENIALPNLRRLTRWGFMRFGEEKIIAEHFKTALDIRAPTIDTPAQSLSGGNQQKIVMSKWLAREPRVLILDEPTRGIDVGAKAEVHRLVSELTAQGVAVLLISSELPEVLGMSDRILVMHEGRLVGELSRADANEERIMALISLQSAAI